MKAEDKLLKARVKLMTKHPFYSFIATRMQFFEATNPNFPIKTAYTDGRDMWWYREFIDKLSVEEVVGLIIHEVLHCVFLHPLRLNNRDHRTWNYACDIAINQVALDGNVKLPPNGVYGPQFDKYKNMTADEIYKDLIKNSVTIKFKFPGGKGDGKGGDGEGGGDGDGEEMWGGITIPGGGNMSPDELKQLEDEIKSNVIAAADFAKSRGNLPAGLEGLVKAVGAPVVNWKAYIQEFVKGSRPDNYTWSRPNRKMLVNHGVYMPRIQLQGAGVGVLSIDTSGSVSDQELREYVTEIAGMIELCNPEKLFIIQHDAILQKVEEWEAGMNFDGLKTKGRGGTCIQPVFKHLDKLDEEINWMILFSDMEIGDWPAPVNWPDYPVLLCSTGRQDTSPKGCGATYIPLKPAI